VILVVIPPIVDHQEVRTDLAVRVAGRLLSGHQRLPAFSTRLGIFRWAGSNPATGVNVIYFDASCS
jgi:hypothetical protein